MDQFIHSQYHWFTLNFIKPSKEAQFTKNNVNLNSSFFKSYIYGLYPLSIVGIIFSVMQSNEVISSVIYKVIQIILLIACQIIYTKKYIRYEYLIILQHILETIFAAEFFLPTILNNYENEFKFGILFYMGIQTSVQTFMAVICLRNWMLQLLIWYITIIIIIARNMMSIINFIFIPILLYGLWIGYFFYNYQRFKKNTFLQDYYQNKNEKKWKQLIDTQIPSAFIVMQTSVEYIPGGLKAMFINQICKQYFNIKSEEDITQQFQNIDIQQQLLQDQINKSMLDIQDQPVSISLQNFIEQQGMNLVNHNKQLHLSNCQYKNLSTQELQYFDIVIIGCKWNNQKSLIITLNDISERFRLQRLKQLDNYKDQLLATVTHDLKTPLNGMILILQMMKQIINDDKLIKYLDIVLCNSFLLLHLINDILDFSRIEQGKLKLVCTQFSIEDLLQEIKDLIQFQADQKQIDLQIVNKNVRNLLYSDKNRIKQILINLVSNALKFTQHGFIRLTTEMSSQKNLIQFQVEDSGVGIPEELIPQLFQLFGTFDHNRGSNQHGVGLGLAICKKLVAQLGPQQQQIQIQSQLQKGSIFTFYIYQEIHQMNDQDIKYQISDNILSPKQNFYSRKNIRIQTANLLQSSPQQQSIEQFLSFNDNIQQKSGCDSEYNYQQQQQDECYQSQGIIHSVQEFPAKFLNFQDNCHLQQKKILIVDDTPFNILGLKIFLEQIHNLLIDEAYNGLEAIEKIKICINKKNSVPYSLIFMDVNMPIMDGIEAIQVIRRDFAEYNFKIISFTAYNDIKDQQKCINAGADAVLTKPITKDSLLEILNQYINLNQ